MSKSLADTRCLTPRELAQRWRCRVGFVRALITSGKLAAVQINNRWRITPEAIRDLERGLLAVQTKPPRTPRKPPIPKDILEILSDTR